MLYHAVHHLIENFKMPAWYEVQSMP